MMMQIVPECYFDTVLVKNVLQVGKVNHQKGVDNVINTIRKIDDFALGIIDKDKVEPDYIRNECIEEINTGNLVLWKHKDKKHYFIQLAPAIERWVLNALEEGGIGIDDLGMPNDLESLKIFTKHRLVNESEEIKKLCKRLVNSESETVKTLITWLKYLYEHNREADINTLRDNG